MRYIILILIFIFCFSNFALAQEGTEPNLNWFEKIYEQGKDWFGQKVSEPVEQGTEDLSKDIEKQTEGLWQKADDLKQQKQEEIKQGIKQEIKKQVRKTGQKVFEKLENWLLVPLKNKVQQGSDAIRKQVNKVKDFFIGIFSWEKT